MSTIASTEILHQHEGRMWEPVAGRITLDDADYARALVATICTHVGPGLPGTPQEARRAAVFQRELERHLGVRNVVVEELDVAAAAWLGSLPISAVLMAISMVLIISTGHVSTYAAWVTAIGALVCAGASLLLYITEFLLGRPVVDRWFPVKRSQNVIGTLRAPGAAIAKRLLIVSGHHDSAQENTWLGLLGYGFFAMSTAAAVGFLVALGLSVIRVIGVATGDPRLLQTGPIGWLLLVVFVVPAIAYLLFFNRGRKNGGTVPGAIDNLAGSAAVVALCRFVVANPSLIPADTEIRFISFGSEEAGLRGSRAYVARHLDELRALDAQVLNFEMLGDPEISILTSDLNGFVKSSPAIVQDLVAAAQRSGVPYKVKPAFIGVGTDAAPFSMAGLTATSLFPFRVPQQLVDFYHQKADGPQHVTLEPLSNVLKLALEWLRTPRPQKGAST